MDRRRYIYQFLVRLRDISPEIWRRIQVPATYTFWDLHVAIQDAMGWLDYHLHAFRIRDPDSGSIDEIGIPDDEPFEDEPPVIPGWEMKIADYFMESGDVSLYEYDFGDGWEHEVILEAISERKKGKKYPICLSGVRACPPEDCGGVSGYEELLSTIADPKSEEYESTMEWLGGRYDSEHFNTTEVKFDNPKTRWKIAFE
jgi:hypothetical protein